MGYCFFFPPSEKVEATKLGQTRGLCAVSRVLLCDTSPRKEYPRALFRRDSDSWRLFPSFTSLFLLAIIASRKQGRPCKMSARHKIFDAK